MDGKNPQNFVSEMKCNCYRPGDNSLRDQTSIVNYLYKDSFRPEKGSLEKFEDDYISDFHEVPSISASGLYSVFLSENPGDFCDR